MNERLIALARSIVARANEAIAKRMDEKFEIASLAIYTHSQDEYTELVAAAGRMGKKTRSRSDTYTLANRIRTACGPLALVRIHPPNPTKPSGCVYFFADLAELKNKYVLELSAVKENGSEMLELRGDEVAIRFFEKE